MSYDVWLEIDTGGPEPARLDDEYWNYTFNIRPMLDHADVYFPGWDGRVAGDCVPDLQAGLARLRADPDTYRAMNPSNGWGDYDSLLERMDVLLAWFKRHPKATVKVWK